MAGGAERAGKMSPRGCRDVYADVSVHRNGSHACRGRSVCQEAWRLKAQERWQGWRGWGREWYISGLFCTRDLEGTKSSSFI